MIGDASSVGKCPTTVGPRNLPEGMRRETSEKLMVGREHSCGETP